MRVYLAGPITGLTYNGAIDWRDEVALQLRGRGIQAVSPMRGKGFILKRQNGHDILAQTYPDAPVSTQKGIVARDRFDVHNSDLVLFNLLGSENISIGTMVEMGWCDAFRKVAVVVMESGNVHDHAFVKEIAGYLVHTLDEAVELITILAEPHK